jgi:hypothetical protein
MANKSGGGEPNDKLLEAYDAAFDATVETLCTMPSDVRHEAIFTACNDDDWKWLAEFMAYELTDGGTKFGEIFLRIATVGAIKVSLVPELVVPE